MCSGTDPDGLRVPTNDTTVSVLAGARVQAGPVAAIATAASGITVQVDGRVDSGADKPALFVTNESAASYNPNNFDPFAGATVGSGPPRPSGSVQLTVGSSGIVQGSSGVRLSVTDFAQTNVSASVDNAGLIAGAPGAPALLADPGTQFGSIVNREEGTLGGVSGNFFSIFNAGVLNGGFGSAVAADSLSFSGARIDNSGQIASVSQDATVRLPSTTVQNSGTVRNSGSGAAVETAGFLSVLN